MSFFHSKYLSHGLIKMRKHLCKKVIVLKRNNHEVFIEVIAKSNLMYRLKCYKTRLSITAHDMENNFKSKLSVTILASVPPSSARHRSVIQSDVGKWQSIILSRCRRAILSKYLPSGSHDMKCSCTFLTIRMLERIS